MNHDAKTSAMVTPPATEAVWARVRREPRLDVRTLPPGVIEFRRDHDIVTARFLPLRCGSVVRRLPLVEIAFGAALLMLGVVAAMALEVVGLEWPRPMGITLAPIGGIALAAMSGVAAVRLVTALLPELPMRFEDGAVVPFPRGAIRAVYSGLASRVIVVEFCWPLDDPCRMSLEVARVGDAERLFAMLAHVGVTPYEAPLPDATWLRMTRPRWRPPRVARPGSRRAVRFPGSPRVLSRHARQRLPRATWNRAPLRPLASRLLPTRDRWCPPRARRRW